MREDIGGSSSSSWTKVSIGTCKNLRARTTRIHKGTACSVKKMFYINWNIKMNKAYQSLPFLRRTLKCSWWKNHKNGIHSNPCSALTCWDKFPDAKDSVMKYCSGVVKGCIDAYLHHMGYEFSKAFDFHQADLVQTWQVTSHSSRLWNSKWKWDKEIIFIIYKFTQIYPWEIKLYLSLSWMTF
jgi:hypothetical protein